MRGEYYYFAATLPMLSLEDGPRLNVEEFLARAQEQLSRDDYAALYSVGLVPRYPPSGLTAAGRDWYEFETALRNEIASDRARRERCDPEKHLRGEYRPDPFLADFVGEAAGEENPLKIEQSLNRKRWEKLEEIGLNHFFNITFLTVYYLKLQLLEKINRMTPPAGEKILQGMLPAEEEAE